MRHRSLGASSHNPMTQTLDETTPLNDHYLEAEFHFGTEMKTGLRLNQPWGYISDIDEDTQASVQGVEKGSYITRLNGAKYTEADMVEVISKKESFTVQLRRSKNQDDTMRDVFYHQYKDYMMIWARWSGLIFAVCGGVIVFSGVSSGKDKCPKRGLMGCGVASIVSGALLWIIDALAKQDKREPVSTSALCCVGASIGLSSCLILYTMPGMKNCGEGGLYSTLTWFGGLPMLEGAIISVISGDLGVGWFMWYFFGMRAQMGMRFYMPG